MENGTVEMVWFFWCVQCTENERERAFIMVTVASSEKACCMKNSEKD